MELSCEKVSARLQPATAGHTRLVLSKTVPFSAQLCTWAVILTDEDKVWKLNLQNNTWRGDLSILPLIRVCFVQSLPDNMTPDNMTITLYDSFLVPKMIFLY